MKNWIVVVEPSPFRRDETYVLGPYGKIGAWWHAWLAVQANPYGEARAVQTNERTRVELNGHVLWPRNVES